LEQYTVRALRSVQQNIPVKQYSIWKRPRLKKSWNDSIAAAFALKCFQPFSSLRAAFAGGGREQDPRLVAIFYHSPALAEKLGKIDFRVGIPLFHGRP
jgi:hypothetical protein